jgi:hypothetical protein
VLVLKHSLIASYFKSDLNLNPEGRHKIANARSTMTANCKRLPLTPSAMMQSKDYWLEGEDKKV